MGEAKNRKMNGEKKEQMVRYNDIQDEMIKGFVRGFIKANGNNDASVILNQYNWFKTNGWKEVVVNCPLLTHKVVVPVEVFKKVADKIMGTCEEYNGKYGQIYKDLDVAAKEFVDELFNK